MAVDQLTTTGVKGRREFAVPSAVLDTLSVHSRAAGACLLLVRPNGALVYHDAGAGVFFERYVVPALRHSELAANELRDRIKPFAHGPAQLWDFVPGVALCALPFVERRHVQGVLMLASRSPDFHLGEDILRLCSSIGLDSIWLEQQAAQVPAHDPGFLSAQIGLFMNMLGDRMRLGSLEQELNSLSTQLANAYEELSLIDQISGGMRVNRRSNDFFRQACLDVMQVMCVRGMGVALSSDKLREEPVLYGELSLPPGYVRKLSDQLLTTLRQRKSCLLVNSFAGDKDYQWLAEHANRLIAVPLLRGEQMLGCLFGLDKLSGDFDSVDNKLLTAISSECAIYLENALLFGDVHDLMMGLLHSLTSAVDAKDAYTCGHSERVALLSRHLAKQAGLSDTQVEHVYMAGLLHDVGKIGVPESVLQKAGKLTSDEFDLVKKHPQIGARILQDVKQLEEVIPGVLHHHERFDGRGYPKGLAGKDIPVIGRVICLADCFDAMTSSRTYRQALPVEVALAEIRKCSGTQFDPELAETFLAITPEQIRILLRDHENRAKRLLELQQTLRTG
jgi:putative nucleotidyltransferase with HDIG domain